MKEDNTQHKSIVGLMAATIRQHWDVDALSDLDGAPISYGELAAAIARTHQVLMEGDIKPGDKVAI